MITPERLTAERLEGLLPIWRLATRKVSPVVAQRRAPFAANQHPARPWFWPENGCP